MGEGGEGRWTILGTNYEIPTTISEINREKRGLRFSSSIISLFFLFFFISVSRGRRGGNVVHPRCKLVPREIVTAFRAMNILRRWKRDRPTDFSHDATRRIFEHFFPGAFSAREGKEEEKEEVSHNG